VFAAELRQTTLLSRANWWLDSRQYSLKSGIVCRTYRYSLAALLASNIYRRESVVLCSEILLIKSYLYVLACQYLH
jgi:hypothetical protein